jgi:hypothetical protein
VYMRIDQTWKNRGIAEIVDFRARSYLRGRNNRLYLFPFYKNACRPHSLGSDHPTGNERLQAHGVSGRPLGSGHQEPSLSRRLHFFNSPSSRIQAEKSFACFRAPLILASFSAD